ncbi:unnamed protein product [Heterobilharzia americana]|nr:unnamed protein product [Heterobilharzia americana]
MTLKFSGTYNVEAAEQVDRSTYQHSITCNVWLLDSTAVAFRVDKRCSGQALLDLTFDYLELLERDFFGLVYTFCEPTGGNLIKWLDPTKRIKKQCKGEANFTFWFRVKFYVPDPAWLQEEYTRYQFFLQVRKDILDGRLPVSRSISVQLAGLALQSELGDYTPEDCPPGYVNQFRFVQNQNADFEVQASEWHRKSSSLLPAAAELEYLNVVRYLDHYGVKSYAVKDGQHDLQTITIGVSFIGISLFRENKMLQQYSWDNIAKINFKGKRFTLHLKTSTKSVNGHLSSISGLTTSPIIKSESELKQHYHFQSATSSSTISATALYAAMSRVARGFQRYFSVTRRSSLSTATTSGPVGGVGRTLSTLMELRRNSRAFGRSFSRTHSRRSDNLTQVIPTCNPTQIIPPLSKSDASTISPTINPLDCSNTGNQSKSYAQIPPGAKITTSGVIGASSENRLTRLSYRNALNQNRESNILLSSHTSANSSAKIKKLTNSIDIESSANISRLSSQSKQIFNETSSQRNSSNTSFNVLDKSSRSKPHKPASPVSGNNVGATRTSQRRQQQHQDMISTSHSHHTIASNDTKFSSKKFQKSPMNGNNMDYTETDSVDVVHNNQAFDKNETTGYWSTRRMQRLQSSSNNMNNSNPLLNTSLTSVTTSVASATVPMTMSASPLNNPISNIKMHSTSNVNKIDDFQDNDRFSHNRVPITTTFAASTGNAPTTTVTTRRSRYMPTDQCVNTTATYINAASVKDSNVNNDIHSSKLLRSSLSSPINRSSTSTRNQVNYSTKGLDQKTEHLDVIVDCDNDVSSSQYNTHHSKGFLKDPFHPGAPDGESTLHPANEVNELNSEGLVHISIRPDSHGRFGFNVKGGIDHGMPVIVSRVGANMPADLCIPRLSEGDQILFINNKDVSSQTHLQVVNLIRAASEQPHGTLELLVKPSVLSRSFRNCSRTAEFCSPIKPSE